MGRTGKAVDMLVAVEVEVRSWWLILLGDGDRLGSLLRSSESLC